MESDETKAALQELRDEVARLRGIVEAREQRSKQQWLRTIVVWLGAGLVFLIMYALQARTVPH